MAKYSETVEPLPQQIAHMNKAQQRIVFLFTFAVGVIVLIIALLAAYVLQSTGQESAILNSPQNINQAYWTITKVSPNANGDKVGYTVNVMSSIGNIRTYSNVQSYGLSNDRRHIVLSIASNMDIVNLADDVHTPVTMPFAYSGDLGNVISWSAQDKYFALTVMKNQDTNDTHLLIFTDKGALVKDVTGKFAYGTTAGMNATFPAKFSPTSNLLLARTYKTDDLAIYSTATKPYTISQLPVYLNIYNLQAESRAEYPIRDADDTGANVIYTWSMDGNYIRYALVKGDKEINYADDYLFKQQQINTAQ